PWVPWGPRVDDGPCAGMSNLRSVRGRHSGGTPVETQDLSRPPFRRIPRACGAAIVGIGAAALVGWATDQPALLGLRAHYIPMAPNTALGFIFLGAGLIAIAGGRRWGCAMAGTGAVLVALIGALRLTEYATGGDLSVDRWFFRVPAAQFGLAPVGKMAFSTSAT